MRQLPPKDQSPAVIKIIVFILLAMGSVVLLNPLPMMLFAYLAYRQYKAFRLIGYFNQYQQLMFGQGITSIPGLAQATNQTPGYVSSQINAMVRQGFMPPVSIQQSTGEIIFPGKGPGAARRGQIGGQMVDQVVEMEAYTCTACKANCQKPKGQLVCDYCGSTLAPSNEAQPW